MHLCKSFRWGEERLYRSPKSLRWDEERLYRSPRLRKFYTFLPAKHCKWGAVSQLALKLHILGLQSSPAAYEHDGNALVPMPCNPERTFGTVVQWFLVPPEILAFDFLP